MTILLPRVPQCERWCLASQQQERTKTRMSIWRLLLDGAHDGPWNMAVDELLLELAAERLPGALRLYKWRQPTLSLGYFQCYKDRWQHPASAQCPVVRRLSGGGAIVHDHELTYSLAIAENHPLSADRDGLYRLVHRSLIAALRRFGVDATFCDLAQPSGSASLRQSVPQCSCAQQHGDKEPFLCFARRAPMDVVCAGHKIAGSAQRRRRGAVMQHGSVILRRSAAAPEIAGISDLTGTAVEADALAEQWAGELVSALGVSWEHSALSAPEAARAAELAHCRYSTAAWTESRQALAQPR